LRHYGLFRSFSQNQTNEINFRKTELMSVKFDGLKTFVHVARSGNLADAAGILRRTPSAVSMSLKNFEQALGAPLFETDRKTKLTALGEFALKNAEDALSQFKTSVTAMKQFAKGEIGQLRIAAVPSVAETILPRAIADFALTHGKVHIDLRDMDSRAIAQAVENGSVDIGILSDQLQQAEPLLSDAFGVVLRHDHPLAELGKPVRWSQISGENLIANDLCATLTHPDFVALYNRASLTVRNTTSLFAMVKSGLGLTVLPQLSMIYADPTLHFIPVADQTAKRQISILRKDTTHAHAASAAFVSSIRASAEFTANALET
jgi:DNA-binding transcriptional LysR family regulator